MSRLVEIIRFPEPVPYVEMVETQRVRVKAVQRGEQPNALFVLEHPPVITLGRNAHSENVLLTEEQLDAAGVAITTTDRGGDVTYHGPGQLIAYPILDLNDWKCSVGWYLRTLEQVLIDLLGTYQLPAERAPGFTGVWTSSGKIAAIGVGVNKWVTFHGIALNVSPEMGHFRMIIPCGLPDKRVATLKQELGKAPPLDEVQERFIQCFLAAFEASRM